MTSRFKIEFVKKSLGTKHFKSEILAFVYGKTAITESGLDHLLKQDQREGKPHNPIFLAAKEAFRLYGDEKYTNPRTVASILKAFKIPYNEKDMPTEIPDTIEFRYDFLAKKHPVPRNLKKSIGLSVS